MVGEYGGLRFEEDLKSAGRDSSSMRSSTNSCEGVKHESCHTHHKSHITLHTSHITRHTSHITHHTSHITHHTSHITHHTSHVTRHTSHRSLYVSGPDAPSQLPPSDYVIRRIHCCNIAGLGFGVWGLGVGFLRCILQGSRSSSLYTICACMLCNT